MTSARLMMDSVNDPSNPAAQQTPTSSIRGKATPDEILPSERAPSNLQPAEQRHFISPYWPPTSNTDSERTVVGTTGDDKLDSALTTPDEVKQQSVHEIEGAVKGEAHISSEFLDDFSHLKKLDLRPCSFTSLADAFRASLCVVRCLRGMLYLNSGCAGIGFAESQPGDNGSIQGLHSGSRPAAADVLSHQESFVADEAAYGHLLKQPDSASEEPGSGPAQAVSEGTSETSRKGLSSPVQRPLPPSGCSGLAQGGILERLPQPQVVPGMFTSETAQTQGRLEYELSVCKALLLLQHLSPNSTTTVEESPAVTSPQRASSQNIAAGAALYSPYTSTQKTSELTKVSDSSCRGFQAAILEILLRVRLLQGTQQLVRADFARLLHQQQKQQQQLLKAVQTTVMKLGPAIPVRWFQAAIADTWCSASTLVVKY